MTHRHITLHRNSTIMNTVPFSPQFPIDIPQQPPTTWLRQILDEKVSSRPCNTTAKTDIYCRTIDAERANRDFWVYLESLELDTPSTRWIKTALQAYTGGHFVGVEIIRPDDIYNLERPYTIIPNPTLLLLLAGLFISGPFDPRTADYSYWFPITSGTPHPLQLVMSRHPAESRLGPCSIELAEFDLVRHERRLYTVVWQEET